MRHAAEGDLSMVAEKSAAIMADEEGVVLI
jgi:hypothetical protein